MSLDVDVRAHIGEFHLDARFHLEDGLTVVFGPSGAGKTRLLRLIAGLDDPAQGRIVLDGTRLVDTDAGVIVPAHERRVGLVSQQSALLPHRSALANVALAVREGDRAQRREAALALLERLDAVALAERRPRELSGGQQQRVALARALAGAPRLLLLDEPFSALDLPVRERLRMLVREVAVASATTTLFVTHDPDERDALADRVLVAEHGVFVRVTPPGTTA